MRVKCFQCKAILTVEQDYQVESLKSEVARLETTILGLRRELERERIHAESTANLLYENKFDEVREQIRKTMVFVCGEFHIEFCNREHEII